MREGQNWFRGRRRLARAAVAGSIVIVVVAAAARMSTGLSGTYFTDDHWEHPAYTIIDRQINSDDLTANAPVSPDQPFSVRWFGVFNARRAARYAFTLSAEGTAAILVDQSTPSGARVFSVVTDAVDLSEGPHPIAVLYSHSRGRYGIELRMSADGGPWTPVRSQELAPRRRSQVAFRAIAAAEAFGAFVGGCWIVFACVWLIRQVPVPLTIAAGCATVLLAVAVAYDSPAWIRGPAPYPIQWQWEYHAGDALSRLGPAVAGAAGIVAALLFLSVDYAGNRRRRARIGLVGAMVGALVLQLGVLHLGQGGAFATVGALTRSDTFTGYFDVAAKRLGTTNLLANYSRMLTGLPVHARTHPPGPVLYYDAFIYAFDAVPSFGSSLIRGLGAVHVPTERFDRNGRGEREPALAAAALVAGLCTVFCAILISWPVARIAEAGGADPLSAARAGALWALCPAAFFFDPTVDALGALLVAVASMLGCFAMTAERNDRAAIHGLGAGLIAGVALFCSLGAAPMLLAAGVTAVLIGVGGSFSSSRLAVTSAAALVGMAIVLSVPLALGFDFVGTVQGIMRLHRDHYTPPDRALWLRFNLLDFSIFLGWPLIVWLVILSVKSRDWRAERLVLAMAALVVVINIADITRSEVGRLWMPLMPLIFAATGIAASTPTTQKAEWLLVAVLLAITSLTIALHWSP